MKNESPLSSRNRFSLRRFMFCWVSRVACRDDPHLLMYIYLSSVQPSSSTVYTLQVRVCIDPQIHRQV